MNYVHYVEFTIVAVYQKTIFHIKLFHLRDVLRDVRPDGASNHRAADRALLEARVAALANGEVPARNEHYCARRRHAHDANALLRIRCRWLQCCRASGQ